jgi:hypothetical protein
VFFNVPGVIFDLASFSFQVPICGSAAMHAADPKKENARVNPIILIFMDGSRQDFDGTSIPFPARTADCGVEIQRQWQAISAASDYAWAAKDDSN